MKISGLGYSPPRFKISSGIRGFENSEIREFGTCSVSLRPAQKQPRSGPEAAQKQPRRSPEAAQKQLEIDFWLFLGKAIS